MGFAQKSTKRVRLEEQDEGRPKDCEDEHISQREDVLD